MNLIFPQSKLRKETKKMPLNSLDTMQPARGGMVITTTTKKEPEYNVEYKNNSFNSGKKYTNSKNLRDDVKNGGKMTVPEAISVLLGSDYAHDKVKKN